MVEKKGSLEMFVTSEFLSEKDETDLQKDELLKVIFKHLRCLEKNFVKSFLSNFGAEELIWAVKPFGIHAENITHLPLKSQEELVQLSNYSGLKIDFNTKSLEDFWLGVAKEFPTISETAINFLLPFSTTYLSEATFSSLTTIKSKYQSNVKNSEEVLRPAVSKILPSFDNIIKNHRHPSH
ncbi:protein FAM200A-like [Stegodyphus dumicola]|uniref:protein FAM200A-like n=1 Tax=Stegodyphus dumicola TaxID=202533 RepID=UPI0015B34EAA|nr:protein FAM200A-like [Stegodyphus dumicola]